jgi:hypothetical protein
MFRQKHQLCYMSHSKHSANQSGSQNLILQSLLQQTDGNYRAYNLAYIIVTTNRQFILSNIQAIWCTLNALKNRGTWCGHVKNFCICITRGSCGVYATLTPALWAHQWSEMTVSCGHRTCPPALRSPCPGPWAGLTSVTLADELPQVFSSAPMGPETRVHFHVAGWRMHSRGWEENYIREVY